MLPQRTKNMRRPAHAEKVLERVHKWRELCPDMTVRSTFIVGFPGKPRMILSSYWIF